MKSVSPLGEKENRKTKRSWGRVGKQGQGQTDGYKTAGRRCGGMRHHGHVESAHAQWEGWRGRKRGWRTLHFHQHFSPFARPTRIVCYSLGRASCELAEWHPPARTSPRYLSHPTQVNSMTSHWDLGAPGQFQFGWENPLHPARNGDLLILRTLWLQFRKALA